MRIEASGPAVHKDLPLPDCFSSRLPDEAEPGAALRLALDRVFDLVGGASPVRGQLHARLVARQVRGADAALAEEERPEPAARALLKRDAERGEHGEKRSHGQYIVTELV